LQLLHTCPCVHARYGLRALTRLADTGHQAVRIAPGRYKEAIVISKRILLVGVSLPSRPMACLADRPPEQRRVS